MFAQVDHVADETILPYVICENSESDENLPHGLNCGNSTEEGTQYTSVPDYNRAQKFLENACFSVFQGYMD